MDGGGARSIRLIENLYIPLSDGVRVAAKIWLPEDAEQNPVPAILEMIPYRKRDGTIYRDVRMHPWIAAQGYACVRVDIRGSGESEGLLAGRISPARAAGWGRDHRLAVAPELVQRHRRHDRHLLGRLQRPAGRRPEAAGAQGHHHPLLDRRPLRRRYPLHGRLPDQRESLLERRPLHLGRPAARSAARRRELAGDLAGAAGGAPPLARAMAHPSAPRRLLEAGLRLRGLRRDRLRGLCDRRLGGQLFQRRAAAAGGAAFAAQRARGSLDPCLSASERAGPGDRLSPGGGALVGSLAEGHRHRDHGRAHVSRLDAGTQGAEALVSRASRSLGGGGCLALARESALRSITSAQTGWARRRRSGSHGLPAPLAPDHRRRQRPLGRLWGREPRSASRPAGRGRPLPLLRYAAPGGGYRDPGCAGAAADIVRRSAAGSSHRAALRCRPGRHLGPHHLWAAQSDPSRRPRASLGAGAGPLLRRSA